MNYSEKIGNFSWPGGKTAAAMVTVDMDAESAVLYTHPETAEQLDVMAHQAYGVRTGLYRLLRIFDRKQIRGTFFIPGFVVERWPDAVKDTVAAGHEIGHHGFLHEYLAGVSRKREEEILLRALESFDRLGVPHPRGYRAPGFKVNHWTPELLAKHGFIYDSSLQDRDTPYFLASGPEQDAPGVIEVPVQWALDDFAYYMHLPRIRPGTGIESPNHVLEIWQAELAALASEGGCFNLTLHPFLSGRASRANTVEKIIDTMLEIDDLWITPIGEVAQHAQTVSLERIYNAPIAREDLAFAAPEAG